MSLQNNKVTKNYDHKDFFIDSGNLEMINSIIKSPDIATESNLNKNKLTNQRSNPNLSNTRKNSTKNMIDKVKAMNENTNSLMR